MCGGCCSPFSPVWVSFRSHGRLQHGGRPQGACCQHPPGLPSSRWHLVSSPCGNQLERGRENPSKRGDCCFCSKSALNVTNLFDIPILLLTLSQLENSRLVDLDARSFIPPAWECGKEGGR